MIKRLFLLVILSALLEPIRALAQEAYAVYTDDGTLTFYYDNQKDSREGVAYELNTDAETPDWYDKNENVSEVVFKSSFANARPTSTYEWFEGAHNLTSIKGIQYLNTSSVTKMSWMFWDCYNLTSIDVSGFNTSNVTDMRGMFGCDDDNVSKLENLDVSGFDTRKVKNMRMMFWNCVSLKSLDVSGFKTSNVTDMRGMFGCYKKNSELTVLDVSGFDTRNVTDMAIMFQYCSNIETLDLSNFDTSNVTDMAWMFWGCSGLLSLDLGNFDTSNVTNMLEMFSQCSGLSTLNVSSFNTGKVTDMSGMFSGCAKLSNIDVSGFDTSNVIDMSSMFNYCINLSSLDVSNFNTSKVKDMQWMFTHFQYITILDLSNFDTANVTDMHYMFYNCSKMATIYIGDGWNTDKVTNSECMFYYCESLVGEKRTVFDRDHVDKEYARIDESPSNPGYFSSYSNCEFSDLTKSNDFYPATCFLYRLGVLNGTDNNGKMEVASPLRRSHLAKIGFRGLYSVKGRTVPETVPSDNFPTVYTDLTDEATYYYQAARALLYLEYGDGVAPFDRNRLKFDPEDNIARIHTLKVLMETFNIQPDMTGTDNPFPNDNDVVNLSNRDPRMMGYIRKAASLGIITTANEKFRPNDNCLRGEAFTMLFRIMSAVNAETIEDPNPQESAYFQPLNTTLKTISLGASLQMGNFQHYTKTSFALSGVVPLAFAHTYNSYNTTLPSVFFGAKTVNNVEETYKPLGDGWSHNYHSFVTVVGEYNAGTPDNGLRAIVHWGGGSIDVYKSENGQLVPESMGVYDNIYINNNEVLVKSKSQMEYRFSKQGSTGASVLYLYSIKDRNGNELTINYDDGQNGSKRISSVTDGNRSLKFSYLSGTDLLSEVKDPLGRCIKFEYFDNKQTGKKQLKSFTDAEGNTTTYEYADFSKAGTSKLLSRIQLPKGNYIENEYDANMRLKKSVSGVGDVPTTRTSISVTANYGNGISTQSQVDVKRGSQTSSYNYTYNGNNVVTEMKGAKNLFVNAAYGNSEHPELPTSIQSNNAEVSDVSYDDKGNVTSVTMKGDETLITSITYDDMNNVTSLTDPKGNKTTYSYDGKGNLTGISAPEGVTASFTVDSKGLVKETTNAMGVKTEYQYNEYGNLIKTTLPALGLSSSAEYDAASRISSVTDALGRKSFFVFNNNDFLKKETDAMNYTTTYDYDKNDNLTSITNAKGGVTTLSYDNATDWLTSVEFAGATKQYFYNSDGTLDYMLNPIGVYLEYAYDELGRITGYGATTYTYDSKHRLASVADGKEITFGYDGFNRIKETNFDGQVNNYSYDKNGNCTKVNDTEYEYDGLDRLTKVTFNSKTIDYSYRKDSQLSKVEYPNGMTTEYGYDEVGRLTSKKTKLSNGTVIASYTYKLDKVGNIIEQTSQEPYEEMILTDKEVSYSYDEGNRITKFGDISFEYDKNGNTTKRGSESYTWNLIYDRLTHTGSASISYDPLGFITSYGDIKFTTDPLGIGNVLSDSKSVANYIYGNGLEARVKDGKASYYVTDVRGSVVAIVDEGGNITHKYQYDEFGNVTQKQEADYNPFQYVGKYGVMYISDNLYYMRARHYDPTIGRFLSEDPIWSTNLYPYADNNPIMGIDPRGEALETIGVAYEIYQGATTATSLGTYSFGAVAKAAAATEAEHIASSAAADALISGWGSSAVATTSTTVATSSSAATTTSTVVASNVAAGAGGMGVGATVGAIGCVTGIAAATVVLVQDGYKAVKNARQSDGFVDFIDKQNKNGGWLYKGSQKVGDALDSFWDWSLGWAVK